VFFVLRETYAPVLLKRKAEKLSKETGKNLRSKFGITGLSPSQYMVRSLVRPLRMLALSPIVLFMSLYMAIVYGYVAC
jgi:hypothetical protein